MTNSTKIKIWSLSSCSNNSAGFHPPSRFPKSSGLFRIPPELAADSSRSGKNHSFAAALVAESLPDDTSLWNGEWHPAALHRRPVGYIAASSIRPFPAAAPASMQNHHKKSFSMPLSFNMLQIDSSFSIFTAFSTFFCRSSRKCGFNASNKAASLSSFADPIS